MAFRTPASNAPTSSATLQAALAQMPPATDDEIVLPPTAAETGADTNEYLDDEGEGSAAPIGQQPAAPTTQPAVAPAGQPAAPAAAAPAPVAGQPPATAAPAPAGTPAVVAPPAGAVDPWAETEDITYTDDDTGESYVVRAPKAYSTKVANGYTRRSMMNRSINWAARNRHWVEPLINNNQMEQIAPFIERAQTDREFAEQVNQLYQRRVNGLPMTTPQAAPAAQQAPQQAPSQTSTLQNYMAQLDARTDIDEYTRMSVKALAEPLMQALVQQDQQLRDLAQFRDQQTQQTQRAQEQAQQQRIETERQRQLGLAVRDSLMRYFPQDFTTTTPREQWDRVVAYAQSSGLTQSLGQAPGTYVVAWQQLQSPTGTVGSAAALSVAQVRQNAEHLAAQAAAQTAQATMPHGAAGAAAPAPAPKPERVPRFVKDRRTGQRRALTPLEVAKYMKDHPNAV